MSFKTVGTLTRTLWARGNKTPPLARSPRVNRLCTTCRISGGKKQGRDGTKEESCGSDSDRPTGDAPSPSDPLHRCTAGDKKRAKEPLGAPGVCGVRRRSFTSTAAPMDQISYLWTRYNDMKRLVHGKQSPPPLLFFCPNLGPPYRGYPARHRGSRYGSLLTPKTFCSLRDFVHPLSNLATDGTLMPCVTRMQEKVLHSNLFKMHLCSRVSSSVWQDLFLKTTRAAVDERCTYTVRLCVLLKHVFALSIPLSSQMCTHHYLRLGPVNHNS